MAESARLVRRAHGELVEVELAQHARARREELCSDGRFIRRREAFQNLRRSGGLHALGCEQVLDAQRHAGKRPQFARSEAHTSELQSLMRISSAVLCLKKQQTQSNET